MKQIRYALILLAGIALGALVPAQAQKPRPAKLPVAIGETQGIRALLSQQDDPIHSRPVARVYKWSRAKDHDAWVRSGGKSHPWDGYAEAHGNLLTTAGATRALNLLIGAGGQALNSTHCRVGVGDTSPTAAASDADLAAAAGSTHRYFALCDTDTVATNILTIQATFSSGNAEFAAAWQEWGIDFGTASGTTVVAPLLNHKTANLGVKGASSSWVFTVSETFGP